MTPAAQDSPAVSLVARMRRRMFGISLAEASFERRGFPPCEPAAQLRFETIGRTFIRGYCAGLEQNDPQLLAIMLDRVDLELRGFAYEGAAMALTLLDLLTPWRRDRLARYLAGPGSQHIYMVHVGAGWAAARLDRHIDDEGPSLSGAGDDPLLRWLVVDGYGFHEGYFHWGRSIRERAVPPKLDGYARRAFDQGLGRSLWFVSGADVDRARGWIEAFAPTRRRDLWSGVGLAATYAGGLDRAGLEALRTAATDYRAELAQGAAFAAEARRRAGNLVAHTGTACAVLCDTTADAAARITEDARRELVSTAGSEPAYETWRQRVQSRFQADRAPALQG